MEALIARLRAEADEITAFLRGEIPTPSYAAPGDPHYMRIRASILRDVADELEARR